MRPPFAGRAAGPPDPRAGPEAGRPWRVCRKGRDRVQKAPPPGPRPSPARSARRAPVFRAGVRSRPAPSRPATVAARSSAAPGRVDGTVLSTRRQARASLMSRTTRSTARRASPSGAAPSCNIAAPDNLGQNRALQTARQHPRLPPPDRLPDPPDRASAPPPAPYPCARRPPPPDTPGP